MLTFELQLITSGVNPAGCDCECPGCDGGYGHCMKKERGCDWTKT